MDYYKAEYFEEAFIKYLSDPEFFRKYMQWRKGRLFSEEPVLRVHGNIAESQIIEGLVLNQINFQSLVTKATVCGLNKKKALLWNLDLGERKEQWCIKCFKSFILAEPSTSNVLAGKFTAFLFQEQWLIHGVSFDSELEAS